MLTSEERGRVERVLLQERARVLENIDHFDDRMEDLRDRAGELSLYRFHPADVGTESQDQEQDFLLASVEGRRLYQIDEALERLYREPEAFGVCEVCGRDIGVERLEVIPETRLCAEHALQQDVADAVDADPREAFRAGDADAV
ncbi:MAG TPA: TraR/DksA C4-type zinc finger protein [Longimicrobium sp.]|jgi:RNA polymerase-binding transcription factor DksA|nr:TraR/DksA C4-type zinc finger protein [Longimicrobium sp.]